jgi:hypothetical protein
MADVPFRNFQLDLLPVWIEPAGRHKFSAAASRVHRERAGAFAFVPSGSRISVLAFMDVCRPAEHQPELASIERSLRPRIDAWLLAPE